MFSSFFPRAAVIGIAFGSTMVATVFATGLINNTTSGQIDSRDTLGIGWYQDVNDRVMPSGAVIASDLASCPTGWTEFSSARGRVIIGAGQWAGLANRSLGDTGGSEEAYLATNQIPSIIGNTVMDATTALNTSPSIVQVAPWQTTWLKNAGAFSGVNNLLKGLFATTEPSVGSGAYIPVSFTNPSPIPLSIMQPYATLLYCKKD